MDFVTSSILETLGGCCEDTRDEVVDSMSEQLLCHILDGAGISYDEMDKLDQMYDAVRQLIVDKYEQ